MSNALFHTLDVSIKVPSSALCRIFPLLSNLKFLLPFFSPFALVDRGTGTCITAKNRGRSVEVFIVTSSSLIRMFSEVVSEIKWESFKIVLTERINSLVFHVPNGKSRNSDNKSENKKQEGHEVVTACANTLLAV